MRIESKTVLLFCLCLWIPAAQLQYSGTPPNEDEDASGDDAEISGSGDDESIPLTDSKPTEVATQAVTNTTKTAWVTDAPVKAPEQTVTQLPSTVTPHADVETAGPTTKAPLLHTSKIPETQPSPTTVKSLVHVKDIPDIETTTVRHVEQEETTLYVEDRIKDEKLPAVPVTTVQSTTTAVAEDVWKDTTVFVPEKEEDGTVVHVEVVDQSTDAPDTQLETTPSPLSTTSPREIAEFDTSGDNVEATTVQAIVEDNINSNVNPEVKADAQPSDESDFEFDSEERPKTRGGNLNNEITLGASEGGNLLERTEVLAGVIAGGLVGLVFAVLLVGLMVYRMKKKDEGSYSLDEHKHPNGGYQRPTAQEEFLA